MTRKLFITRTEGDLGNSYLYAYSQQIIDEAKRLGWDVQKEEKEAVEESRIHSRLSSHYNLIIFNGHGEPNAVYGHEGEAVLSSADARLLSTSITYIRACAALSGLGKAAVKEGAAAVVGYRGDLWIPQVNEYKATPLKDPAAQPVMEVSNLVATKLLKGSSVTEAVEGAQHRTNSLVEAILLRNDFYDNPTLQALVYNDAVLGFEGNGNARA